MADCGTLTVVSDFARSAVQVTSCPTPESSSPGGTQPIEVSVANRNSSPASLTIEVVDGNGNVLGSRSVQVGAGETQSPMVELTAPDSTGEYEINARTTDVTQASTQSASLSAMMQSGSRATSKSTSLDPRGYGVGTLATAGVGLGAIGLSALKSRR